MPDYPAPFAPTEEPHLQWRSLRDVPSQLPVGDYSQYHVAFGRARASDDGKRLYAHSIRNRDAHMGLVTLGFQVAIAPFGFATVVEGELGLYFDPDVLARTRHQSELLTIPLDSYHLFSKSGLPLGDRVWFIGIDALQGYFGQRAHPTAARRGSQKRRGETGDRAWFWERVATDSRREASFEAELRLLGLDRLPATLAELKLAWKEKLRVCHPDVGGSVATAQEIGAAYETLRSHLESLG